MIIQSASSMPFQSLLQPSKSRPQERVPPIPHSYTLFWKSSISNCSFPYPSSPHQHSRYSLFPPSFANSRASYFPFLSAFVSSVLLHESIQSIRTDGNEPLTLRSSTLQVSRRFRCSGLLDDLTSPSTSSAGLDCYLQGIFDWTTVHVDLTGSSFGFLLGLGRRVCSARCASSGADADCDDRGFGHLGLALACQ